MLYVRIVAFDDILSQFYYSLFSPSQKTIFSPIMKLVDMFYFSKMDDLTPMQRREQMKKDFATELETARGYAAIARIQREDAAKMKAVKQELYGKFITRVPVLRMERFPDFPLHTSTAKPCEPRPLPVPDRICKF